MGRKDTLAAKSIRKMYEQLNLNQSDVKLIAGIIDNLYIKSAI